jgi:hypothetical protein
VPYFLKTHATSQDAVIAPCVPLKAKSCYNVHCRPEKAWFFNRYSQYRADLASESFGGPVFAIDHSLQRLTDQQFDPVTSHRGGLSTPIHHDSSSKHFQLCINKFVLSALHYVQNLLLKLYPKTIHFYIFNRRAPGDSPALT